MTNRDGSNPANFRFQIFNCALDFLLVFLVKSTGGLVENKDLGVLDNSACKSYPLLLATRELATA